MTPCTCLNLLYERYAVLGFNIVFFLHNRHFTHICDTCAHTQNLPLTKALLYLVSLNASSQNQILRPGFLKWNYFTLLVTHGLFLLQHVKAAALPCSPEASVTVGLGKRIRISISNALMCLNGNCETGIWDPESEICWMKCLKLHCLCFYICLISFL